MKKAPMRKASAERKHINLAVPIAWVRAVDEWRRNEPDLPNFSEAIRRLVGMSLERKRPARRARALR